MKRSSEPEIQIKSALSRQICMKFTVQMVGARAKCLSPMVAGSAGDLLVMVLVVLVVQELPVDVVLVFVVVQVSGEDSGRKNHEATEAHCNNRRDHRQ